MHIGNRKVQFRIFPEQNREKSLSVGMSPTVVVNWNAPDGDKLTFPIGLGISKMTRVGSTPVRFRIEVQYSVVRPETYDTQWNFHFQAVPVIRSPFAK